MRQILKNDFLIDTIWDKNVRILNEAQG